MSRNGPSLPAQGPALGDVARLWSHLTTEWVIDLEIRLEPGWSTAEIPFLQVSVVSSRLSENRGGVYVHTWAKRVFNGVDYKGSYNQLYDLLIVAHRAIERELMGTERLPAK